MIIGIVDVDQFEREIKKEYVSYAEMFKTLFLSVDREIQFKVYDVLNGCLPESLNECDAYLITGSKYSVYNDHAWISDLKTFISRACEQKKILIGICFGHQIIASVLGGVVEKSEKGWGVGNVSSRIEKYKDWMGDKKESYSLLVSHQDQVLSLPFGAELIASNDFCLNSSYQINNNILCFQGHPEYTVDYLTYLLDKRHLVIGLEKTNKAKQSLNEMHDGVLIAKWIVDFIQLQIKE